MTLSHTRLSPIGPHNIDPDALKILRRLRSQDFQAYVVGGGVRDILLGHPPKDFDLATDATPSQIRRMFRNCRIIGRRFQLAHIFFGPKIIETATFRKSPRAAEAEAEDADSAEAATELANAPQGREAGEGAQEDDPRAEAPGQPRDLLIRRDNVFGTAEEDARRRDFTVNGLFYDAVDDRVIDFVGGVDDLERGVIRTIGDPQVRFREDPIRILRAIRFAARLGFTIEPTTYQALIEHRGDLVRCAAPRVLEDVYRLLRRGTARKSLVMLREAKVLDALLPALAKALDRGAAAVDLYGTALDALDAIARRGHTPSNSLLLAALLLPLVAPFTDVRWPLPAGDPSAAVEAAVRPIFDRLKVPRREADRFRKIVLAQRRLLGPQRRRARPMETVRRDDFPEALGLLEILVAVRGDEEGALERWRSLAQARGPVEPSEAPRRRRRRGRRRGGGPGGPGGPAARPPPGEAFGPF
ncbi:MAG: polynucleotide adenylyltransferase PcnB [Myxococcota bacterium]